MKTVQVMESLRTEPEVGDGLTAALHAVTLFAVTAFGSWTIACHLSVVFHVSFSTLSKFAPLAILIGAVCAVWFRNGGCPERCRAESAPEAVKLAWVAAAAALVLLRILGVGYKAFWIGCVLLLSAALLKMPRTESPRADEPADLSAASKWILIALVLITPVLTYIAHRPDIDDAVYVGTAADAVAHPELPVLSHDVLYGDNTLPLMLPSYSVESYELLIGAAARLLGGSPIYWAHAVFPTVLAMLVPISWGLLMRILTPKYWVAGTLVALVVLTLPADFRGFGNFAFVRLFQGKALFVSSGIPLLFASAWSFAEYRSFGRWLVLAATAIACIGLTASAIFVVPMALAAAALSGWCRGQGQLALLIFLPAIYPLACGLIIRAKFASLAPVFAKLPAIAPLAATMVFGSRAEYVIFFGLLAAPFLQSNASRRRLLVVLVLCYFFFALNPYTFKLLSKLTTRDAVWRLLWCVPVSGIVAAGIMSAVRLIEQKGGKLAGNAAIAWVILGIGYLLPYSSLFPANGVSYSLRPLKVNLPDYEVARAAIQATPQAGSILAPEAVAVWIPTFVHRPPLVSIRALYDDEMGAHLQPEDAATRRELRELVSGTAFAPEDVRRLLDQMSKYSVGLIVTGNEAADRLSVDFGQRGYLRRSAVGGCVFFVKTEAGTGAH